MRFEMKEPEGAADEFGRDVIADGENENENGARAHAGQGLRQVNAAKRDNRARAHRARRAHIAGRDRFHHAVKRQNHERQQNVGHRHDGAESVVNHFQSPFVVDDSVGDENIVQNALLLQKDDPRSRAHEQRSPKRQQDEDEQNIRDSIRQRGEQKRGRIAEQQRAQRDEKRQRERAREKAAVNGAIGRLQLVGVGFGVVAKIEGGVVIIRGERSRELFDDAPGLDAPPFFVDFEQRRAGGGRVGENGVVEFGDAARAFAKQPRKAGHFVIEPLADAGGGFVARALAQIGQHRGVNRIGGRALAVPLRQFGGGARQVARDDRAVGAALGHVQHRGDESDQQKREQGRDRRESEPFFAPLGAREASRQSREGVGGGGGGH